jgi:hypothetical protein
MGTGLNEPHCNKANGYPCAQCRLDVWSVADTFAQVIRESYTPKELRKLNRVARRMGSIKKHRPNN